MNQQRQLRLLILCFVVLGGLLASMCSSRGDTSLTLEPLNLSFTTNSAASAPLEKNLSTNRTSLGSSGQWATANATCWGRTEVGWLRFSAVGDAAAQSPIGSASEQGKGRSLASWFDYVTVNAGAGLAGQPGQLTAKIVIDGSITLGGGDQYAGTGLANQAGTYFSIEAKWNSVSGTYGGGSEFNGGSQLRYVLGGGMATTAWNGNLIGPGEWLVTFPITFGQLGSVYVTSQTIADARAVVYGPANGTLTGQSVGDFSRGIRWAGITEVRTTNGTFVTNFTVSASSGFDYVAGVSLAPPQINQTSLGTQGFTLQWTDSIPRSYTVETTPTLPAASWIPVPGMTWPINTNTATIAIQLGSNAFFRVRAQ